MSGCQHENFTADVAVARILDGEGTDPVSYVATVKVSCADCGEPFGFRGPPAGVSWREPRCAIDARSIDLPLMDPSEQRLAGPLPAAERGPMVYEVHP